jgi:hypothetical protein
MCRCADRCGRCLAGICGPAEEATWPLGESSRELGGTAAEHRVRRRECPLLAQSGLLQRARPTSASLIGRSGSSAFQTIHQFSVDAARGLVLLFGIGTKALPSWDSKTRWNNLWGGLAVKRTVGPSGHTISPHPSSREGHHSTARWSSRVLLSGLILHGSHAAAASRVQRNSVPSTQMRCMITANRRG